MFFQQMRFKGTSKKAGITGMGQREYVRYFDRVIRGELEVLLLCRCVTEAASVNSFFVVAS